MTLTHRRTSSNIDTNYCLLFCDNDNNTHYGEHVWVLHTNLPRIPQAIIDFAAEYYMCSEQSAEQLVNPDDIVCDAGAWDDPQFVSDLWQAMEFGQIEMVPGYRTEDGAVVLDRENVKLEYQYTP